MDFFQTYAPVLHYKSLRVILAIVALLNLEMLQFDVPTAFLNAECKEDVYMRAPAGEGIELDENGEDRNTVCKLNKTLYGIKQAPREWNSNLNAFLLSLGYSRCSSDTCAYVRTSASGKPMILPVFVDDVFPVCATEDLAEMKRDIAQIMAKYDIPECGEASVVLGMRITRDCSKKTLKLDQQV